MIVRESLVSPSRCTRLAASFEGVVLKDRPCCEYLSYVATLQSFSALIPRVAMALYREVGLS